jgi:hypothetical protein
MTDNNGAFVDITAKSSAYLPVQEASIHKIKRVEEAGIVPGMREEFVIIGENEVDDSLILSLRSIQYELAWERCRQLQAEDAIVKGKVGIYAADINYIYTCTNTAPDINYIYTCTNTAFPPFSYGMLLLCVWSSTFNWVVVRCKNLVVILVLAG